MDAGCDVLDIGLAGWINVWAVTQFDLRRDRGDGVAQPHYYNGAKIVKSGSRPLDDAEDFQVIKRLAESTGRRQCSKRVARHRSGSEARIRHARRELLRHQKTQAAEDCR